MNINYSNKLKGLKKRVEFIDVYLKSDDFQINRFFELLSDLEDAYFTLYDTLKSKGFEVFRDNLYRRK